MSKKTHSHRREHLHHHRPSSSGGVRRPADPRARTPLATRPDVCLAAAALGGVGFALAAPEVGAWPLAWIAALPIVWLAERAPTARRAGLYGWVMGLVMSAIAFRWFAPFLVRHAGLPGPVAWLGMILLSAYHGLLYLIFARAVRAIRTRSAAKRDRPWPMALVAPLVIVAIEIAVPLIFQYQLAITQASVTPVIQIADLVGPYGVTALLFAFAGAIWDAISAPPKSTPRRRFTPLAAVTAVVVVVVGYGLIRIDQIDERRAAAPHLRVGLIQPNESQDKGADKSGLLAAVQQATADLERRGAELVVWSEALYPPLVPRTMDRDLAENHPWRIRKGFTGPVIVGALSGDRGAAPYNSVFALAPDGAITARHDKIYRMLGSEYLPLIHDIPALAGLMPQGAGHLAAGDHAVALPVHAGGHDLRLGAMVCLEDILPGLGRDIAALDPHLLVNVTNDTWFGDSAEPWQHLALARFRTIELRTEMVRAVSTGPTSHVDAVGRLVAHTDVTDPGVGNRLPPDTLLVDVAIMEGGGTVYATIGAIPAWACALAVLWLWLLAPWRERWQRRHQEAKRRSPPLD